MNDTIVELKNVSKDYYNYKNNIQRIISLAFGTKPSSTIHAIKDVSFKVYKGERIVIYGAPDAGVSTLLKTIMGITYQTKGKVIRNGSLNGYMARRAGYDYELSSEENVYMKANAIGLDKKIVKDNWEYICQFAEIDKCLKLPIKNAPSGAIVRLALVLHLLVACDVFVLDDKFGLGGTESKLKCEELLKKHLEDNEDLTFITANLDWAYTRKICNRGIVIHKGEILFDGDVEEAYPLYVKLYKNEVDVNKNNDKNENAN